MQCGSPGFLIISLKISGARGGGQIYLHTGLLIKDETLMNTQTQKIIRVTYVAFPY